MGLRCFVSIELPQELKSQLSEALTPLTKTPADVKWVPLENLHVTLKFLGPVQEGLVPEIESAIRKAASAHKPTAFTLLGAGGFPSMKNPRVIWLGMKDTEALAGLQADVEAALAPLGFEPEGRKFSPHLTIGRVRSKRGILTLKGKVEGLADTHFGAVEVSSICLMKSDLSPSGARYTVLREIKL